QGRQPEIDQHHEGDQRRRAHEAGVERAQGAHGTGPACPADRDRKPERNAGRDRHAADRNGRPGAAQQVEERGCRQHRYMTAASIFRSPGSSGTSGRSSKVILRYSAWSFLKSPFDFSLARNALRKAIRLALSFFTAQAAYDLSPTRCPSV